MGGFSHIIDETDDLLTDYPEVSPGDLAASFERSKAGFDGTLQEADAIIAELRRRQAAGVRRWNEAGGVRVVH